MIKSLLRKKMDPDTIPQWKKDAAVARMLYGTIAPCQRCLRTLAGHEFHHIIASAVLRPGNQIAFRDLLDAVKKHDWTSVASFKEWEGDKTNVEVYALKCVDGGLSIPMISSPLYLEDPHTLLHQEIVGSLPDLRADGSLNPFQGEWIKIPDNI